MDFVEAVNVLEDSLVRTCVLFNSSNNMQKTIKYNGTSTVTININGTSFNNITDIVFVKENDALYLHIIVNKYNFQRFLLSSINTLEVIT